ncbi:MAG: hypothetical protein HS116_11160 [Planctomycetes bacterium]|nr:hypothetical protein [Planctomycetota bacterium]
MPEAEQPSSDPSDHPWREGPKIARDRLDQLQGLQAHVSEAPTWRGWIVALIGIMILSVFVPYSDFVLAASWFSFNSFPMLPVVYLLLLVVGLNLAVRMAGRSLGLTRQDLTLVFVMTYVVYAVPGVGFWAFFSTGVTGPIFHARPENNLTELVHPFLSPGFFPSDPLDPSSPEPRPVEWFYTGLPQGQSVPWAAWWGPYWRWSIVVACMYGLWFSIAALLHKRWSEQERLPFPMAQVPEEMLAGVGDPSGKSQPFLSHGLARLGILTTFLVHSVNALNSYYPNVPTFPLENWNWNTKYLTEPPWNNLGSIHFHFFPSIVGLTYLLSLEVAFSLWFFYIVQKLCNLALMTTHGGAVLNESYNAQGAGALLAMVLLGFWAARSELGRTLRQALGREPYEARPGEPSPRLLWGIFALGATGSVMWLSWAGVTWYYGVAIVMLFILVMTGLARLVAEAGVFSMQFANFPVQILQAAVPPTVMGAKNTVMLTIWDRMFSADWYRIVPLPHIMNCLHLARTAGLRGTHALGGMAAAVALMLALSFGTFLTIAYTQGGVNGFGWFFNPYPRDEAERIGRTSAKVDSYTKKEAEAAAQGKQIPLSERPKEAQRDWNKLAWMAVGAAVLAGFVAARRFLFWWPHPSGYVLWMAGTIDRLWFAFFLGWLFKWLVSKFGGMKLYNESRRFFIGLVIGEALAAVFWTLIALWLGHKHGYAIRMG